MAVKVWCLLLVLSLINDCIETNDNKNDLNNKFNETHKLQKRGLTSNEVLVGRPAPEWWKSWWREYISDVKDPTVRPFLLRGSDVNHILSLRNEVQTHIEDEDESEELVLQRPRIMSTQRPFRPDVSDVMEDSETEVPIRPTVPSRRPTFRPKPTVPSVEETDDTTESVLEFHTTKRPSVPQRTVRPFSPRPTVGFTQRTTIEEVTDFDETEEPTQFIPRPTTPSSVRVPTVPAFRPQRPFTTRTPVTQTPVPVILTDDEELEVTDSPVRPPIRVPPPPPPSFRPFQPQQRPTLSPPVKGGPRPQPTIRPKPTFAPPVKAPPPSFTRAPPRVRPTLPPEQEEEVTERRTQRPRPTISPPIKSPPLPTFRPASRPTPRPPVKGVPTTQRPIPTLSPEEQEEVTEFSVTTRPPIKSPPTLRPRATVPPTRPPRPTFSPPIKSPPKTRPPFIPRTTTTSPVKGRQPPARPPTRPTIPPQIEEEDTEPTTFRPRTTSPPVKSPPTFRPRTTPQPRPTFAPPIKGQTPPPRPRPPPPPRPTFAPPVKAPPPRLPPQPRPRPTQRPEIEEEETIAPPIKTPPKPSFRPIPRPPVKGQTQEPRPGPQPRPPTFQFRPTQPPPQSFTRAPQLAPQRPAIEGMEYIPDTPVPPQPPLLPYQPRPVSPPVKGGPPPRPRPTSPPRVVLQPRPTPTLPPFEVEDEDITEPPVRPRPPISPPIRAPPRLPPRPTIAPPVKEVPTRPVIPRTTVAPPVKGSPQPSFTRAPPPPRPRPTVPQQVVEEVTETPVRPRPTVGPPIKVVPPPALRPVPPPAPRPQVRPPIREEPPIRVTQSPIDDEEEDETEPPIRQRPTIAPPIRTPPMPSFRPQPTFAPPVKGQPPVSFRPRPFPSRDSQISSTTLSSDIEDETSETPERAVTSSTAPPFGTRTTRPKPRPLPVETPQTRPTFAPPVRRPPVPVRPRPRLPSIETTPKEEEPLVTTSIPFLTTELTFDDEEVVTGAPEDDITEPPIRPRPTPSRPQPPPQRPPPAIPPSPSQRRPPLRPIPSIPSRRPPIPSPADPLPRLPVPSLQPPRQPLIGVKTGIKTPSKDRSVVPYNPPLGPSVTLIRPDRPLPNGTMPPCGLQGKNFCILTNDYPMTDVKNVVDKSFQRIRLMYEELQTVGDPELFQSHLGNSSASRGQFACQTESNVMLPGWAQDAVSGDWMVIVNTDIFPQKVRTESCRRANEPCDFVAPFYESTCQQRFSLHRLIAIDPNDPNKSPIVALFKFPAGCSCRVDPIRKESKKKRKRETFY